MASGSAMMLPTRMRGFNEANGSWKTICIRWRVAQSLGGDSATRSWPSKRMLPADGSMSLKISRPVVDLPQPDSPTRPSTSPRSIVKLTPSTARSEERRVGKECRCQCAPYHKKKESKARDDKRAGYTYKSSGDDRWH